VHGIHDATAFVEMQSAFRQTMDKAGNTDRLVQVYSDHSDHSYLSDPTYVALFDALLQWVDQGSKPTPQRVADACKSHEAVYGAGCRIMPGYTPPPFDSRVAPR
jgi:hypothetical protein